MRENDPRKDCVIKAKNTKEAYSCVRNPLTLKCGTKESQQMKQTPTMKCGAGKCGNSTK